jgi:hypothetical protein
VVLVAHSLSTSIHSHQPHFLIDRLLLCLYLSSSFHSAELLLVLLFPPLPESIRNRNDRGWTFELEPVHSIISNQPPDQSNRESETSAPVPCFPLAAVIYNLQHQISWLLGRNIFTILETRLTSHCPLRWLPPTSKSLRGTTTVPHSPYLRALAPAPILLQRHCAWTA